MGDRVFPWSDYLGTYGPGVVVERPWWRVVRSEAGFAHLQRCDGIDRDRFTNMDAYDTANPLPAPKPLVGQVWAFPKRGPSEGSTRWSSRMVTEVDECAWRGGGEWSVIAWNVTIGSETEVYQPETEEECEGGPIPWPPDAVLVYGPSAPWAPVGWKS